MFFCVIGKAKCYLLDLWNAFHHLEKQNKSDINVLLYNRKHDFCIFIMNCKSTWFDTADVWAVEGWAVLHWLWRGRNCSNQFNSTYSPEDLGNPNLFCYYGLFFSYSSSLSYFKSNSAVCQLGILEDLILEAKKEKKWPPSIPEYIYFEH